MNESLRRLFSVFLAALVVAGGSFVAPATSSVATAADDKEIVRIIVELRDIEGELSETRDLRDAAREVRKISDRVPRKYASSRGAVTARDMRKWRVVEVAPEDVKGVLEQLYENPAVLSAREEHIYHEARVANDPQRTGQYGLRSTAQFGINAEAAWDVTTGSSSTVIAIIDGGVDLQHEDLDGKIWTNGGEIAGNGVDDDGNGYVDDVNGWDFVASQPAGIAVDHGTHVAGIAAAESNNGVGVTGVDWGARIMSIRALSQFGAGREDDIVQGINYAVANGAHIINMSIVGRRSNAILAAIENAYASGVLIVAAAGNNGVDSARANIYPACAQANGVNLVLGVGATDDSGQPARFSNYGDCVDISAPGDDILSTAAGDRYREMTGTSMSSPFVAGVAGLYRAQNGGASPAAIISALSRGDSFIGEDAAETAEWNALYAGRLNAAVALGAASPVSTPTPTPDPDADPTPTPNPTPTPQPASSGGDSGGGGGDSGGGGGGGGGGEGDCCPNDDEQPSQASAPKPTGQVAGARTVKANLALIPKINAAFRSVFGRNPRVVEHSYWLGRIRRGEKQSFGALVGAMAFQNAQGRTYDPTPHMKKVAGATTASSSGSLVSKINAIHRQAYGRNPSVSEHGYWLGRVTRGEKNSEAALLGAMIFHRVAGIPH